MPSYQTHHYIAPLSKPIETTASIARRPDAPWRVICIPGTPARKRIFARIMRRAPDDIEMVTITRPGFASWHDVPETDFKEQVKAIEPFLGDRRTIVLGVSYGGLLSLNAALSYQDQIEGVVTVAALVREAYPYGRMMANLGEYDWANRLASRQARHVSAEIRGRRAQLDALFEQLGALNKPVEIIHGDWDTLVPYSDASRLKALIGENAQFNTVRRGTHWLEMQTPNQIYAAIRRLIERLDDQK